jgi:hypothetical protein
VARLGGGRATCLVTDQHPNAITDHRSIDAAGSGTTACQATVARTWPRVKSMVRKMARLLWWW